MISTLVVVLGLLVGALGWANGFLVAERESYRMEAAASRAEMILMAKRLGRKGCQ